MATVKDIKIKVIPSNVANDFIRKHHYSGKVVPNSQLHFGAFLNGILHGVMSYGPSLDKSKTIGLVKNTTWNEFLELNRMAFDDVLPQNSESRCISVSIRLLKKNAPQIKWIISFADGTQCGDGTIYRASGFVLTGIKTNKNTIRLPDGTVIHKMTLESAPTSPRPELNGKTYYELTGGHYDFEKYTKEVGGSVLIGNQLRYIYLIDKSCELNVPIIPFSKIDEMGAGMYRGKKIKLSERKSNYNKQESDVSHLSA